MLGNLSPKPSHLPGVIPDWLTFVTKITEAMKWVTLPKMLKLTSLCIEGEGGEARLGGEVTWRQHWFCLIVVDVMKYFFEHTFQDLSRTISAPLNESHHGSFSGCPKEDTGQMHYVKTSYWENVILRLFLDLCIDLIHWRYASVPKGFGKLCLVSYIE